MNRRNSPLGLCVYKYVCAYICIILSTSIVFSLALMLHSTKNKQKAVNNTHTSHPGIFKVSVKKFLCLWVFVSLPGTGVKMKWEGVISSLPKEGRNERRLPWAWSGIACRTLSFSQYFVHSACQENFFLQNVFC